jgi:hypothetical protein
MEASGWLGCARAWSGEIEIASLDVRKVEHLRRVACVQTNAHSAELRPAWS